MGHHRELSHLHSLVSGAPWDRRGCGASRRCGHLAAPSCLIASTNGKSNTATMTDAVLGEAGLQVGRYAPARLDDPRERGLVGGRLSWRGSVLHRRPLHSAVCTLAVAWQGLPKAPVAVAANRDERLDRPSEGPARRKYGSTIAIAPQDARVGGTWAGYNEHGLFVGITNRWGAGLESERSRGLLVADILAEPTARAARETVEGAVERHGYAGFQLVVADAETAVLFEWDGDLYVRGLTPGVTVVVNVGAALPDGDTLAPGEPSAGRVTEARRSEQATAARQLRERLAPRSDERAGAWLDRSGVALGEHESGVCVHGDGFGTRSSSLLALGDRREYRFAPGPPCETPYREVDEQV